MEWFGDCRCVPSSKHISTDKQTFLGLWEPSQNLSNRRYCYSEGGKPELLGFFTKRRKKSNRRYWPEDICMHKMEGATCRSQGSRRVCAFNSFSLWVRLLEPTTRNYVNLMNEIKTLWNGLGIAGVSPHQNT